jgi:hypothetical protein
VADLAARAARRVALAHLLAHRPALRRREPHRRPHPPAHVLDAVRAHAVQRLRALPRLDVRDARGGLDFGLDAELARERRPAPGPVARDAPVDVHRRADVVLALGKPQHVHPRAHLLCFFP